MPKRKEQLAIGSVSGLRRMKWSELKYIIIRNVFLLTNGIIFGVVILLFVFDDFQAGLFLGIITFVNIFFGLIQDINAWLSLEKLQLLTAPKVTRIKANGSLESVLVEEIKKGDRIKLKIGDQVPCDSKLLESHSLEINEGLITGESNSVMKNNNDLLLAGSVVTSGSGVILIETVFRESRIARMTEGIKRYTVNLSPIQYSVNQVVRYFGYVLLVALVFAIGRGFFVHAPSIQIVKNVGALASMLVPIGLVFTVTLFFAYGAAHLFRRHVLLQEVNATEKLGRIKNLCMDKTGTLTENILVVEKMFAWEGVSEEAAKEFTAAYIQGTGDTSQTINAVKNFIGREYGGEITGALTFSSWRQYGAVGIKDEDKEAMILAGSPDAFLPHITNGQEKEWLKNLIGKHAPEGKRMLCIMRAENSALARDISNLSLSIVTVFVFYNNLREGIKKTIDFFQKRGVHVRIISGDHPETVRTVAALAGINNTDKAITGSEMKAWTEADFNEKVGLYTIFARIVPEQKEKIISAFKKNGFTAMVGDGANDALAIKNADLGIAMFDGAPATRQLAGVVLMNNSFAALPGGVELADSIIGNVEVFASIFLNLTFLGLFLFVVVSVLGYSYPLTPLNVTLINYFTVGIPGILISYWAIRPVEKVYPPSGKPLLKKILPFAVFSAAIQALALAAVFILSPANLKAAESNILVIITFIALGYIFFAAAPSVYRGFMSKRQKLQILVLAILESFFFFIIIKTQFWAAFFSIVKMQLPIVNIWETILIIIIAGFVQFWLAEYFTARKS